MPQDKAMEDYVTKVKEYLKWEKEESLCHVIIVRDGIVHSSTLINGANREEKAAHAEALLLEIAARYSGGATGELDAEQQASIRDYGYALLEDGSACIVWSFPGESSYPSEEFNLEEKL